MILDTLERSASYRSLHPAFEAGFAFLKRPDLATLPDGRYDIDGDRIFALIMQADGRGRKGARLEAHRRYIDIQAVTGGKDVMGWRGLESCRACQAFDADKDVGFANDRPTTWITVRAGEFAVFFPDDAHAPLAGSGPVRKVVVKIALGA